MKTTAEKLKESITQYLALIDNQEQLFVINSLMSSFVSTTITEEEQKAIEEGIQQLDYGKSIHFSELKKVLADSDNNTPQPMGEGLG
jgi:hypothetical protein